VEPFDRITQNPEVMGGKACVRGTRVTVGMIVGQIGAGHPVDGLLSDYPTSNTRTFCKRCATQPGRRKSAKWRSRAD